jgi:CubicO group peptidase (beta-lactamase class C family)
MKEIGYNSGMHRSSVARLLVVTLLVIAIDAPRGAAQSLASTSPESVGMSSARLERLTSVMDGYARDQQIAGSVTLVARAGKVVYFKPSGYLDIEKNVPMRQDTIFRIASMSKALTTVGAMMLVEEGRLLLTDPVSKYIPAFANIKIKDGTPAKRPISIRHLMTHTAGVSYGSGDLTEAYAKAGFNQWYFADKTEPIGHWIEKLATLPFEAQPGERYVYGYSTDILGHVIEKISGMPLDRFLAARIIEPLKMTDTSFFLPAGKQARLAVVYGRTADGPLTRGPDAHPGQGAYVTGPRASFSGGAGMLATTMDYARFLQMLLNGGELDGVRLLSPKTIELMTVNHIGTLYTAAGRGFGLGFETVDDLGLSGRYGSQGEFSWGSAYFSRYWVDPQEQLVAVFMTQLLPSGGSDLQEKLRVLVNQAIVGPLPAAVDRTATTSAQK